MRTIGQRRTVLEATPSADALRQAGVHQRAAQALAAISSTGIAKGVYRFASHEAADAQREAALTAVVVANVVRRRRV